jgi:hypothetical protein
VPTFFESKLNLSQLTGRESVLAPFDIQDSSALTVARFPSSAAVASVPAGPKWTVLVCTSAAGQRKHLRSIFFATRVLAWRCRRAIQFGRLVAFLAHESEFCEQDEEFGRTFKMIDS